MGVHKEFLYFTSSSTESNNLAILGMKEYRETSGRRSGSAGGKEHVDEKVMEELLEIVKG